MNNNTITLSNDNIDQAKRIIALEEMVTRLLERVDAAEYRLEELQHDWPHGDDLTEPDADTQTDE